MFANAPGVPAAPPTSGLVASSVRPDIDRWEQGLAWVPERCATGYQLVPWCDEPAVGYDPPRPGAAYHRPVGLRVADECSTMGGPVDVERVRRVADAAAPFVIARELWGGALGQVDPFTVGGETRTNAHLASSDAEIVANTGGALVGFGALEQAAMEAAGGQHVMLHAPVRVLPLLHDCFRHVGQTLITHAGNVLVADPGYPGTGPTVAATGETQTVTVANATGGTLTLGYDGQNTAPIAFDATGDTVQAALRALGNLTADDVTVTGGAGGPWTVAFTDRLGDVSELTADGAALTGDPDPAPAPTVTVTTATAGTDASTRAGTWLYATAPVAVLLSPLVIDPDEASRVDRATNTRTVWTSRVFAAVFDPCVHLATELTV